MISAKIISDSVSDLGARITTFVLQYPRFIHSELMTHRMFSRNAASSRAIPFTRMVAMIKDKPAMPVKWGSSKPGMQSGDEVENVQAAINVWLGAMDYAIDAASYLDSLGVHKSISNRILEPFAHMTTIVTATDYHNFFKLRAHPDAQPEFQELAYMMLDLYLTNIPNKVNTLDWHIPFSDRMPDDIPTWAKIKVATARCARISYLTFEGDMNVEKDIKLHDRLAQSGHWSPFEHCAQAIASIDYSGNFRGWRQYRKTFNSENSYALDLHDIRTRRLEQKRIEA